MNKEHFTVKLPLPLQKKQRTPKIEMTPAQKVEIIREKLASLAKQETDIVAFDYKHIGFSNPTIQR